MHTNTEASGNQGENRDVTDLNKANLLEMKTAKTILWRYTSWGIRVQT